MASTTPQSPNQTSLSVADRINELERQQTIRYTYLDPEKRHRVSDPTLKAIQKKALLSFYERHHHPSNTPSPTMNSKPVTTSVATAVSWRSEPQLAKPIQSQQTHSPPPEPPPKPKSHQPASRRASSASDYAKGGPSSNWRDALKKRSDEGLRDIPPRHQHSNSCGSLSNDLLGPVIVGPSISIDDWVPERPPKNPHLRTAFPDLFQESNHRIPSPDDLPPPSPPTVLETEINNDEPLPPPPPEVETTWSNESYEQQLLKSSQQMYPRPTRAEPQVSKPSRTDDDVHLKRNSFVRSSTDSSTIAFAQNRSIRRSVHHHSQKQNGRVSLAISQKTVISGQFRAEPLRPHHCQKPEPQVPSASEIENFRSRTASVTENGSSAPPLQPRQTKAYQSMRHNRQQFHGVQRTHPDDFVRSTSKYHLDTIQSERQS